MFSLDSIFNSILTLVPLPLLLHSLILHFYLSLYLRGFIYFVSSFKKILWAVYYLNFSMFEKMSQSFILRGELWVKLFFAPKLVATAPLFSGFECYCGEVRIWCLLVCVCAFSAYIPSLFPKFLLLITLYHFFLEQNKPFYFV